MAAFNHSKAESHLIKTPKFGCLKLRLCEKFLKINPWRIGQGLLDNACTSSFVELVGYDNGTAKQR